MGIFQEATEASVQEFPLAKSWDNFNNKYRTFV